MAPFPARSGHAIFVFTVIVLAVVAVVPPSRAEEPLAGKYRCVRM